MLSKPNIKGELLSDSTYMKHSVKFIDTGSRMVAVNGRKRLVITGYGYQSDDEKSLWMQDCDGCTMRMD